MHRSVTKPQCVNGKYPQSPSCWLIQIQIQILYFLDDVNPLAAEALVWMTPTASITNVD